MPCALTSDEAYDLLHRYVAAWDRSKERSSSGKPKTQSQLRLELGRGQMWRTCQRPELAEKNRSIGQIRAFVDMCGGRFEAVGIRCADGMFIQPDQQVMQAFVARGYVRFVECPRELDSYFELTDDGRAYLGLFRADSATQQ